MRSDGALTKVPVAMITPKPLQNNIPMGQSLNQLSELLTRDEAIQYLRLDVDERDTNDYATSSVVKVSPKSAVAGSSFFGVQKSTPCISPACPAAERFIGSLARRMRWA